MSAKIGVAASVQLATHRKDVGFIVEDREDCGILSEAEEVVRAELVLPSSYEHQPPQPRHQRRCTKGRLLEFTPLHAFESHPQPFYIGSPGLSWFPL